MMQWAADMPGTPSMVPLMRHWVREILAGSPLLEWVELVISELTTNAVRHSASGQPGGTVRVEIIAKPESVHIEVYDNGPRTLPASGWTSDTESDFGRGLQIVSRVATEFGHDITSRGHRAWADLDLAGTAALEAELAVESVDDG